jgi:Tol biopolymer transport system component
LYNEFTYYRVSVDDLSQPSVFFTAPWLASRLAWSPKGDRILAVGYAQVGEDLADHAYLIDLEGHFQQIPLEMVPRNVSWHPSGEKFVYDYYEKDIYKPTEIRIFDLNTQEEQELTDEGKVASSPGFSPNGKHLVYISTPTGLALTTRNCIYILHVETKETTRLGRCYQSLSYPVWSPDGKYLAFLWLSEPPNWPFPGSLALSIYEFETDRYIILAEKGLEGMPPVWIPR